MENKVLGSILPVLAEDKWAYILLSMLAPAFPFVFIDGMYRNEIMDNIFTNQPNWRYIVVHDSEREEYHSMFDKFKSVGEDLSPEGINLFVCKNKSLL